MEGACCLVVLFGGDGGYMHLLHQEYPDMHVGVWISQLISPICKFANFSYPNGFHQIEIVSVFWGREADAGELMERSPWIPMV